MCIEINEDWKNKECEFWGELIRGNDGIKTWKKL